MPSVQMSDGTVVDLPDNPTPELKAAVRAKDELWRLRQTRQHNLSTAQEQFRTSNNGATPPSYLNFPDRDSLDKEIAKREDVVNWYKAQQGGVWDKAKYYGKLVAGNVAAGAAGLPALLVDWNLFDEGGKPIKGMPASETVQGIAPKPQTKGQEYIAEAAQGAGGALASGAGLVAPVRSAITGAASGLGSEAAGSLSDNPLARLVGGLAAGTLTSAGINWLSRMRPNTERLAQEALDNVDPATLEKARAYMQQAARDNTPVDLAQALEAVGAPSGNITTIRNVLANSQAGDKVQALLNGQPTDLSLRATTTIARMPGTVRGEQQAANNLQETATTALERSKAEGSQLWRETLNRAQAALRASTTEGVRKAVQDVRAVDTARRQLQTELVTVQRNLASSSSQDAAAVAARNADIARITKLVEQMEEFTLPRGRTSGNTGRLLELPQRGEAIQLDQITREAAAERARAGIKPEVQQAPSYQTNFYQGREQQLQQQIADTAESAATAQKGLQEAVAARRAVTHVPTETVQGEVNRLRALAAERPRTPLGKSLSQLADNLDGLSDASQIEGVLKASVAKSKSINLDTPGMDAGAVKFLQGQVIQARKNFESTFEPYRQAGAAFRQHREEVYNPLKQGLVGNLAGKGYREDVAAPLARMRAVFEAGVDPQAKTSPIREAAKELAKVDKEAFADAAKTYYSAKVAEAFRPTIGGAPATNSDAAKNLYDALFKNEKSYQGMKDTVASIAKSYGQSERDAVRGLNSFAQIIKAMSNVPATRGGLNRQDIFELSGRNYGADVLRFASWAPFMHAARRLEDRVMRNTLSDFDNLLTTPEGVQRLIELSKVPAISDKALTIMGLTGANAPSLTQQPE